MHSSFTTYSARDAKAKFGEVLDAALGNPVGITKHDRLSAYLVSKSFFETMLATIENLEDQLWLLKADAARREGFASPDDTDALLVKLGAHHHGSGITNHQTGDQGNGGAAS